MFPLLDAKRSVEYDRLLFIVIERGIKSACDQVEKIRGGMFEVDDECTGIGGPNPDLIERNLTLFGFFSVFYGIKKIGAQAVGVRSDRRFSRFFEMGRTDSFSVCPHHRT